MFRLSWIFLRALRLQSPGNKPEPPRKIPSVLFFFLKTTFVTTSLCKRGSHSDTLSQSSLRAGSYMGQIKWQANQKETSYQIPQSGRQFIPDQVIHHSKLTTHDH